MPLPEGEIARISIRPNLKDCFPSVLILPEEYSFPPIVCFLDLHQKSLPPATLLIMENLRELKNIFLACYG